MKVRASYKLIGRHPFKIGFDETDYYTKMVEVPDDYDWNMLKYYAIQDTKEGYELIMLEEMETNQIIKEALELWENAERNYEGAAKNEERYHSLKPLENKYFKNKNNSEHYFYVDFISKESFRPFGIEIFCTDFRISSVMDDPKYWEEISKEDFLKEFDKFCSIIKKKMQL